MNYADLFRITLPETALEVAALLVLVVDLGFLKKASLKVRAAVAAVLGVGGCGAALWLLGQPDRWGLRVDGDYVARPRRIRVPQPNAGILVLTALTLLLLVDSDFTKHVGEFVAVVLMSASGGLLIAGAQDLLVIFIGLELLSLGLYILTAFAKRSAKSAEAAMKYYLFGGMSAAFLLFGFSYFYGLSGTTKLAGNSVRHWELRRESIALRGVDSRRRWARFQSCGGAVSSLGARHVRRGTGSSGGIHRVCLKSGEFRTAPDHHR